MSLPVSEERALTGIEQSLLSRDPRLKSLFAIFTRLTWQEAMPSIEQLRRRRWQPPAGAVILLAVALIVGVIVLGSFASASGCGPAQKSASTAAHPSASAPSASNQGCSPAFDLRR
jgi:Protein of unknown function (DUF3040)